MSESPCVIEIIGDMCLSAIPDTGIVKEFEIFFESTLLNNLQSIVKIIDINFLLFLRLIPHSISLII